MVDVVHDGRQQGALESRLHVLARLGAHDAAECGKQGGIAGTRALRIALADHRADARDARRQLLDVALAFRTVAVERRVAGAAFVHGDELPAKIGDIAHALAQPWPRNGGC